MSNATLVEIYEDAGGGHRWRAKAQNGRIIADSGEGYDSRGNAERAAAEVFPDARIEVLDGNAEPDEDETEE